MHGGLALRACALRRGVRPGRAGFRGTARLDGAVSSRQAEASGRARARALSTPRALAQPGNGVSAHRAPAPAAHPALPALTALAQRLRSNSDAASGALVSAAEQLCASAQPEAAAALVQVAAGISPKLSGPDKPLAGALAAVGAVLQQSAVACEIHLPLLAALKGFATLALARGAQPAAGAAPASATDLSSLAMTLCSACLGQAGSHRSAVPLLSPDVAAALLEVCACSRLPPALPLWAELGFRHHRLGGDAVPPAHATRHPLDHAVVLARRRTVALERATEGFRDPTSPPRLREVLPVSPEAFLWQARGGVWFAHNDCLPPERVLEQRRLRGGAAAGQQRELSFHVRPAAEDAAVDVPAWIGSATTALEAAAAAAAVRDPGEASPAIRLVPVGAHPAVDVPRDRSNALRFVAALWREVTGRVVHADGVSEPSTSAVLPSAAFLSAAFRLCSRGADLGHLRALAAADGVQLDGPVLVLAVRQAVRYGDVPLAHAFVEDAALRALVAAEPAGTPSPETPASLSAAPSSALGPEVAPDGLLSHVLLGAGVPRAAAEVLLAEAAAGGTPTGIPLPGAAAGAAAVRDAYCELVQACAARPAAVQAVSAYYSMLQAGVAPSFRTVAAAVQAQAAIPLFEDVEASLAAVLEVFLNAVGSSPGSGAPTVFWVGSAEDARVDESGAPAACVFALAACVEAAGRLGSAGVVRDAYERVVAALTQHRRSVPTRLAEAFIAALAADGARPGAALDAAAACARMGARLTEAAVLPILEAAASRDDVSRAFAALRLMAASGAEPSGRTETALLDLCVRVAHSHLPVPQELVDAARREREERGIAEAVRQALAGEALSSSDAGQDRLSAAEEALEATLQRQQQRAGLLVSSADREARMFEAELVGAPTREAPSTGVEVVSAPAAAASGLDRLADAPSSPIETLIRRYSVFNNSELGRAVVAVLRGRLFPHAPPAAAQPRSAAASFVLASQTARALCTGVIRGAVQLLAAEAREVAAAGPQGRAAKAGGGSAVDEDRDGDGDALDVSREMLVLALHEWPNTQTAYEGREARLAASTPQGRAAAMRRRRSDVVAARAQAAAELLAVSRAAHAASGGGGSEASSTLPRYRTFETMLFSSLGFGDFLAQLRAARAPLDANAEARQARAHGGQLQRLPPVYGAFMLFKRLCPDEDGSGTLGRDPVFPVRWPQKQGEAEPRSVGASAARRRTVAPARSVDASPRASGPAEILSAPPASEPADGGSEAGAGALGVDVNWLATLEGGGWDGPEAGSGPELLERAGVGGRKAWNSWVPPQA